MTVTTQGFTLRDYQVEAVDAIQAAWARGVSRPAVVLSTGAGKTVVFAELIRRELPALRAKGLRVLVLAHREKLLEQAADKIERSVERGTHVGIVKGSRDESEFADVVVASVQTLARENRRAKLHRIGLIIVDECHLFTDAFKTILEHYGAYDGRINAVGFTATLTRADGGLSKVWQATCYEKNTPWFISQGYLSPPVGLSVQVESFNLANTRVTAGDLNSKDVAEAMMNSDAFEIIADAYATHAADRPGIAFLPDVRTAKEMTTWFLKSGIAAELIVGTMPSKERTGVYERYDNGTTQVLVGVDVLSEGFDAPHTSCVVLASPTLSPARYTQRVGRGLRLHPGKEDCLILDVSGASQRHTLACVNDLSAQCTSKCHCSCTACGCVPKSTRIVRGRPIPISGKCKCRRDPDSPQGVALCGCSCTMEHKAPAGEKVCPCTHDGACSWVLDSDTDCDCETARKECGCDEECEKCGGCVKEEQELAEMNAAALILTPIQLVEGITAKSMFTWLTTNAGIRFLAVGKDYVCLLPAKMPGTFHVGIVNSKGSTRVTQTPAGVEEAVQLAEERASTLAQAMADEGKNPYNQRKASWRRGPASPAQLGQLERLGFKDMPSMTKGAAADLLTKVFATRILDSKYGNYMAGAA